MYVELFTATNIEVGEHVQAGAIILLRREANGVEMDLYLNKNVPGTIFSAVILLPLPPFSFFLASILLTRRQQTRSQLSLEWYTVLTA